MRLLLSLLLPLVVAFNLSAQTPSLILDTVVPKITAVRTASTLNVDVNDIRDTSRPADFEANFDELYAKWYLHHNSQEELKEYDNEARPPKVFADSVYLLRLDSLHSAIPLSYNKTVRSFIKVYTENRRTLLGAMLGLSSYYFPIFEEALDREGLPLELKYLPVIESALNPKARSQAGASGLWQFIYSTGRQYGLTIDSYIDERMDPQRSTDAAIAYLKSLYKIYNDWILVIAAYNCGPGNVNKAIARSGNKRNYWDIYYQLPKETRGYVPAFIAAIYAFNYYDAHGIRPTGNDLPTMCDTIRVSEALHFEQVASVLDLKIEELRDLNPQYRHDIIPAGYGASYTLVLPYQKITPFIENQAAVFSHKRSSYFNESERLANPNDRFLTAVNAAPPGKAKLIYSVKSGDAVSTIANKFGVSQANLRDWNGIKRNLIRVGQRLTIYVDSSKAEALKKKTGAVISGYVENKAASTATTSTYVVRPGDTLWDISKKFKVSTSNLLRWNQLTEAEASRLKPGQVLRLTAPK